jgi:hypothetical protein
VDVSWWIEHAVFYVIGLLFVYGLLDIAGLARSPRAPRHLPSTGRRR